MHSSLEVTIDDLTEWTNHGKTFSLIDVREIEEREAAHIGGIHMPLSTLRQKIEQIPQGTVVFYCRSGARSLIAAKKMTELLQRDTFYSLQAGMLGIKDHSKEITPPL